MPVLVHGWLALATLACLRPRSCAGVGDYSGRRWLELSFVPPPPCGPCRGVCVCLRHMTGLSQDSSASHILPGVATFVLQQMLSRRVAEVFVSHRPLLPAAEPSMSEADVGYLGVALGMASPAASPGFGQREIHRKVGAQGVGAAPRGSAPDPLCEHPSVRGPVPSRSGGPVGDLNGSRRPFSASEVRSRKRTQSATPSLKRFERPRSKRVAGRVASIWKHV